MRFPAVIVGCASLRNCPQSRNVSTMSCCTFRKLSLIAERVLRNAGKFSTAFEARTAEAGKKPRGKPPAPPTEGRCRPIRST
jgi:hypothetical protein